MIIAVDFDGTIVDHRYPEIGREKPFAINVLKRLAEEGNKIILWSVREGKLLEEAVQYCRERGLEFYAVNSEEPSDALFGRVQSTRKLRADLYIDDRNLGGLPEWGEIYEMVNQNRTERRNVTRHHRFRLFGRRYKL